MQHLTSEHAHKHEVKSVEETTCCIVGAGPAGDNLALLLARKGIPVTLLEAQWILDTQVPGRYDPSFYAQYPERNWLG